MNSAGGEGLAGGGAEPGGLAGGFGDAFGGEATERIVRKIQRWLHRFASGGLYVNDRGDRADYGAISFGLSAASSPFMRITEFTTGRSVFACSWQG